MNELYLYGLKTLSVGVETVLMVSIGKDPEKKVLLYLDSGSFFIWLTNTDQMKNYEKHPFNIFPGIDRELFENGFIFQLWKAGLKSTVRF
jgi:hypothetical protein